MARRLVFLVLATFLVFCVEFILFNLFGQWFHPNLLLLLIIFAHSYYGVRYGICVALMAGLLKDSFSLDPFGIYILSFLICIYGISLIKKYFYELEAVISKIVTAFSISVLYIFTLYAFISFFSSVDFRGSLALNMIPEVVVTTLVSIFVFKKFKLCALRLSV